MLVPVNNFHIVHSQRNPKTPKRRDRRGERGSVRDCSDIRRKKIRAGRHQVNRKLRTLLSIGHVNGDEAEKIFQPKLRITRR